MMRRALFILALSVAPATLPVLTRPAAADPAPVKDGPGTAAVRAANTKLVDLLKKKAPAAELTKSVRAFLDIDQLGKAAMATHWGTLKKPEQDEFLKVLRELIEANYVNAQKANLEYTVEYLGETINAAGHVVVNTKIKAQRKGRPFSIDISYEMVKHGAALQAFDVVTDGVSLVNNYQQMFNKLIKDKGFAGLMDKMKAKLAEIQKQAPAAKT